MSTSVDPKTVAALLEWYLDMGVDETVAPAPGDMHSWTSASAPLVAAPADNARPTRGARREAKPVTAPFKAEPEAPSVDEAAARAAAIAKDCADFDSLAAAVAAFDGCPLKAGARNTVFADGKPGADLLVIGEAPGRDEDRIGRPFVGRAGQLLDRMLAAIDRSRDKNVLISNVIFWRPPGNRTPTQLEVLVCRPFVDRLIEITAPKVVLLAGGAPLQALLGVTGIMRSRGTWREIETASGQRFPALAIFHPAFLLRQPAQKRLAWADLLSLQARLRDG